MLSDELFLRYQRQISVEEVGELGQERLSKSHVLIVGCGGLGCSVALFLAASGIGKMVLCDDDIVESSNLQRQIAYRVNDVGQPKVDALANQISDLNPNVSVRKLAKRLEPNQLGLETMLADIVIDCTDNFQSRQMINLACYKSKKLLISGAAIGWKGQLAVFNYSKDSACYRCLNPLDKHTQTNNCTTAGIVGPVVGTIGNLQALVAIQIIALSESRFKPNVIHIFDGLQMEWQNYQIPKDTSCDVCGVTSAITNRREA